MKRFILTLLTLWHLLAAPAAAGTPLVVALDPTYPPMESEDQAGRLVGFDLDVGREIARRLGRPAEFKVMSWDGIISGLVSKRYDVIISAMNVTPDREKEIAFVEYARMSQLFVVKKGTPVRNEADLAGRIVAVAADTTSYDYLQKARAKGLPIKEIHAFRLAPEVFLAVKTGHAEVLVVDEPVARYYVKLDPGTFEVTGRAMAPEPIGIGIRKDDPGLRRQVEEAVAAMKRDGTMKRLSETWFGAELGASL